MNIKISIILITVIGFLSSLIPSADINITDSLEGIWEQEGYGRVLKITNEEIIVYDISKVSCVPSLTLPKEYISYIGEVSNLTDNSLTVSRGINQLDFKRLDAMPDVCNGYDQIDHDEPIHNFESIWHTFNEQYCAFGKREADWAELYKKYRPQINASMSDVELFIIVKDMLDELKDGHVGLYAPDDILEMNEKRDRLKAESNIPSAPMTPTNTELKVAARKSILNQYVGDYKEYNKGVLRYGMMDNGMAYLQINAMEKWSDFGLASKLSNEDFWKEYMEQEEELVSAAKSNIDGANVIMDKVIADTKGAKGYVLDIRFNGGGFDEVALSIMNHFSEDTIPVFTKKARKGNSYTRTLTANVEPSPKRYTGKVYVLTSVETASAAEIMTLAAREMPNVTLIGSETEGIFSDILEKQMPNGWGYGLSNEIYETIDGLDFESKGVPPDYKIEYRRWTRGFLEDITDDLKDGDDAIEKIVELID